MFRIKIKEDKSHGIEEKSILLQYKNAVLPIHRKKESNTLYDSINTWCISFLKIPFEKVICASPKELMYIRDCLDVLSDNGCALDVDMADYLKNTLYPGLNRKMKKKNAKTILLEALDLIVCPYCNRNYIYNIKSLNAKQVSASCELDHFLPKDEYPLLAVSFYNLIPSCHFCNHTKGRKQLKAFYPYGEEVEDADQIRFTYIPVAPDYITNKNSVIVDINVHYNSGKSLHKCPEWNKSNIEHDLDILKLRQLYEKHNDVVQKLLLKYKTLDDSYVQAIYDNFKRYFVSKEEVKCLIYDIPNDTQDIKDIPLGKLKTDILAELYS